MAETATRIKALPLVFAFCALCALCTVSVALAGCAGSGDVSRFAGTWDLQSGTSTSNADSLTEDNVASMRALGLEAYLNLDENGSLALVTFDSAKYGSWSPTSDTAANATVEDVSATIELDGEALKLVQPGTTLVFSKGDPKNSGPAVEKGAVNEQVTDSKESQGLSEMVVRGALLDEPVVIADDELCSITVDGTGVDRFGDPGFNVQIANNSDKPIDVWVLDPFVVDGSNVTTYLFETIDPGKRATSFIQFDVSELSSMGTSALVNVSGVILVDDEADATIAEYPFKM